MSQKKVKPKIVCLGAGTGQATALKGLKRYECDLTGVVGGTDNGGSSGVLRKELGIPQPGDTRNCLENVSDPNDLFTKIFAYRFNEGSLKGTSLGNLILAALTRITGDFGAAVMAANSLLETNVQIYPVSVTSTHIACELKNGKKVVGEWEIILRKDKSPIKKIYLTDDARAFPPVIAAIEQADLIVIGPGSLFTGVLPHFLIGGMAEAIRMAAAKKVYICNMMTQPGQTEGYSVSDHLNQVKKYLGKNPDYVIVNNGKISPEIIKHYKNFRSAPVKVDQARGVKVIAENLAQNQIDEAVHLENTRLRRFREWSEWTHLLRHDAEKLAEILMKLVK
ncbi:MAG: YvcK family protein [bacterium]|nr:YvcK family protein [bacterium]